MKKIILIALSIVLLVTVFAIESNATEDKYWTIDANCLVKSKVMEDGSVPMFKQLNYSEHGCNGLIVGIPMDATYTYVNDLLQANENYTIKFFTENGDKIDDKSVDQHIGTTDVVKVYDSSNNIVAVYGLVTYGDSNGDGYVDALDAFVSNLCLRDFITYTQSPAVYESVIIDENKDDSTLVVEDYQMMVNKVVEYEEITKGRTYPIDETITFDSVIYNCDNTAKPASISFADSNYKDIVTVNYNGSPTVPSAPGIYAVSLNVPGGTKYKSLVPGNRDIGFIVIAPKSGTGYTTIVDNANKNIIIDINKPNATGADLTGYIKNWVNSEYSLNVSSKNVANSSDLLGALALRSFSYYKTTSNIVSITEKTITNMDDTSNAALGCYLPDDLTLWNNSAAQKSIPVSVSDGENSFSYNIVFRQNSAQVSELSRLLFFTKANAVRGQRGVSPIESTGVEDGILIKRNYKEVFVSGQRVTVAETGNTENYLRTVVGAGKNHPTLLTSLGGTGLKTALMGDVDTIMFVSSSTKAGLPAFSSSSQLLYNGSMKRYSAFGSDDLLANSTEFLKLLNNVLGGMNISVSATSKTNALIGKTGWVRYACADDATGLRYASDMYMEFTNVNSTDAHNSLLVVDVEGCTITTNPDQNITNVKDADGNITSTYYKRDRMIVNEPFRVTAKLKAGYKLSVTDANGNPVPYDAENDWYIMPSTDVTVTAVPE